jgi:LDH2 family malate/lactate/ureidoglycolate dehydrogenase
MSQRYDAGEVARLVAVLAEGVGVPADDAAVFADALVDADIHGTATHGVSRVDIYLRRIQQGLIEPRPQLEVEERRPAVLVVDAGNGLGQVQATKVVERLLPLARRYGVAAATIRRSQHFGALSYYCNRAASAGMALLAATNCEPAMSPTGGCQAYFGTNPIAASFPTGKGFPIKIDLSTSVVARGNIIRAARLGQSIDSGWALDPAGNPTTDPKEALLGTVLTMAGHKGYALAVLVEILAGVLSGSAVGSAVGSMYKDFRRPQDVGHFFFLLDIAAFMDIAAFIGRIDRTIDEIKACRRRPGVEEILVPGERSFRTACDNRRQGVPLEAVTLGELRTLCTELNVPFPF